MLQVVDIMGDSEHGWCGRKHNIQSKLANPLALRLNWADCIPGKTIHVETSLQEDKKNNSFKNSLVRD